MFKSILASVAACVLASTALAQGKSYYIPNNTPNSGSCNLIPFGDRFVVPSKTWSNQKYQTLVTNAQLGNSSTLRICDIGFAACGAGVRHFDSIEIVLAQTNATTLSTTFATNLSANVQTVLAAEDYDWHRSADVWNRIGLDKSYNYTKSTGANLVIQITVVGARAHTNRITKAGNRRTDGQTVRMFAINWSGTPPAKGVADLDGAKIEIVAQRQDLATFGVGCKGSKGVPTLTLAGAATIGTGKITIDVSNCIPGAVSLQVLGLARLPSGFSLIGAPGCRLYETPDLIFGLAANAAGVTTTGPLAVPKDNNLACFRIYAQGFPADASANSWQRTASNYGRILIGY